ncbi:hypothetical protein ACRAQ6_12810 [Erythrobacter sp. HA6-11]
MQGFIIFAVMLWIYVGARLAAGSTQAIAFEALFALVAAGIAQLALVKWPPGVGIAILLHGAYDAIIGPHTGVAEWYPPMCAGFDLVFGAGLLAVLYRKSRTQT